MDHLNGEFKRKVRPAQRLYVPPAQRGRTNKTVNDSNEIISKNDADRTDINPLRQEMETLTLRDNDLTPSRINETPQIDTNSKPSAAKIDTTDAENEEMIRAMANMNRKSSRPIIKHTANYLPANNVLQISTESKRNVDPITAAAVMLKPNEHVSNWEDLINEDEEGNDYKHDDSRLNSFDGSAYDDADEPTSNNRLYCHNISELDHVIELYDFPGTFRTQDLITLYNEVNSDSSYIKWCDETHALLVVGTAAQALRALDIKHDIVKSRPVTLASPMALQTIERCDLRPAMKRPQTSMHTARRMITSALGTKSNISVETQKLEREALRKAKEMKRTQKQNEQDAWEGNPRPSTV